jgi:hypothetical protein
VCLGGGLGIIARSEVVIGMTGMIGVIGKLRDQGSGGGTWARRMLSSHVTSTG